MRILASLLLTTALVLCAATANAGEFRLGVNGGYNRANDLQDQNMYTGQLYGQYVFDHGFGIEGGYNYFGNGSVSLNGQNLDVAAHGPYAAVSLNADLGQNLDMYARAGAFYSIFNADGKADSDKRVSPFVGVGLQFAFTSNFYGRLGYDHYFKAADTKEVKTDFDMMYAGLGFNI